MAEDTVPQDTHPSLAAEDLDYRGVETKDSSQKGSEIGPGIPGDLAAIKRFMGQESRLHEQDENKLRTIMGHAQKQGVETDDELAVWLKKLSLELGTPDHGMTRVNQLIHYLDLDDQIGRLMKEQRSYVR